MAVKKYKLKTGDDIRRCPEPIAGFSGEGSEKNLELKRFLNQNMYHHRRVRRMEFKAELYLTELFNAYLRIPQLLPDHFLDNARQEPLERRICDYISSMTDRSSIDEYRKLFSPDDGLGSSL